MEKRLSVECVNEGSHYIDWDCIYKGRRYTVRTFRGIADIHAPDSYVWEIGGIACDGPPYNIPLWEWSEDAEEDPPWYSSAEEAAEAAALRIDEWLRQHGQQA